MRLLTCNSLDTHSDLRNGRSLAICCATRPDLHRDSGRMSRRRGRLTAVLIGFALIVAPAAAHAKALDSWWYEAMRLGDAHKQTTGKGVTVAVIDDALDPAVPDLRGADIEFGQACDSDKKAKPAIGNPQANHGTAMTTLIAGQGTGNAAGRAGVKGIAPDATIRFYTADSKPTTEALDCSEEGLAAQFDRAVADGVDIISYSITNTPEVEEAVKRAIAKNIVVVAGAGAPKRYITSPADVAGVVSVFAVDKNAKPWKHNPHMRQIFKKEVKFGYPVISAPGVDVLAGAMDTEGNWYSGVTRTGTSDATAITSGLLALVKSKYPAATGNQLIQHLIHYPGGDGGYSWDQQYGFGIGSATNMLPHDPTQWSDVNPLLNGPYKAVEDFPMDIRDKRTPTATPQPSNDTKTSTGASDSDDGAPLWACGLIALFLLAAAAGLAVLLIRRRPRQDDDGTGPKSR